MSKIGVLLTNTGTPDAPTPEAVRRYLREFLSDRRIVHLPRAVWLPILYGIILPFRAPKSAKLYENIWVGNDSPMREWMKRIAAILERKLPDVPVAIGMNYGNPSIEAGLKELHNKGADTLIVLPLFPQYSHTSAGSTFDRVEAAAKRLSLFPEMIRITEYAAHPDYIDALAHHIEQHWQQHGRAERLLISFHGIPERFVKAGDPYPKHCIATAEALANKLALNKNEWILCFQSQFGYDKWLQPSTQTLLTELPQQGIKELDIICPGFAVDCLETLEEIKLRGHEDFIAAGGKSLRYIPALNDSDKHIDMIRQIVTLAMPC